MQTNLIKPMSEDYADYLRDESRSIGTAERIAFPRTTEEIKAVLKECYATGEKVTIPADSVLLAMGVKSRWAEADALRRACPETSAFLVGDCLNVGNNVKAATSGALLAAAYI